MKYFDFRSVAREARIPDEKLRKLVNLLRQEFPHDPMLAELHALRACLAIRDGHIQIDDALKSQAANQLRGE
jgi:mRNA-degrading endonuclease YafQ of YafQ-DinJ toxin-antitoxin module